MPPEQPGLTRDATPEAAAPEAAAPEGRRADPSAVVRPPRTEPDVPAGGAVAARPSRPPKQPKAPKPAKEAKAAKEAKGPKQRIVARRVRRVLRRLDPWSVLKVSLIFYVCLYIVTMVAGVLLWNLAARADLISRLESFVEELGAFERWELEADVILQQSLLIGAILVVLFTGMTVLGAILFNLISDLVGGIRVVVIEEESARPAPPKGGSVRRSAEDPSASSGL